jgi:3',5'-cyclic AMP phosphodiesterase CpdA
MILCQITDLHIKRAGRLAYRRVDTTAYLARCVARINALIPQPDAIIITGDLVDFGDVEEYTCLKKLLAPLTAPYYLVIGNHDGRAALRTVFAEHAYLQQGGEVIQYAMDLGPLHLIVLDTQDPPHGSGRLCSERSDWLAERLDESRQQPTVIAMHHPPFHTGIGHMDKIGLPPDDITKLAEIVRDHPQVERLLCGHLHRAIETRFAGTIASTCPATAHQVALDLRPDAPSAFVLEPPGFQLHQWHPGTGLVTHTGYVEAFDGPYPFFDHAGVLID